MRICITRTEKGRYSETFIQNQINRLAQWAEVFPVHDGRLPQRDDHDQLLSPGFIWALHNLVKGISGVRNNYFGNYGLRTFLKKKNIDAVLANYGIAGAHIWPVCEGLNLPLVVHFHGFDATQEKVLDQYGRRYKKMFAGVAGIVVVSTDMKNKLLSLGADERKIALIPYGIDLKKFSPVYSKDNRAVFVSVGRFAAKKSPQSTIRAFAMVKEKLPGARLIMIGQKSGEYEACRKIAGELNISDAVVFAGVRQPAEIVKQLQQANVFVQHSVTAPNGDMEGTPNTVLEAAACGLPVVSTKHAGIKEAVVNGKTGFLVEEHDVSGMAQHMLQFVEQPALAVQMGREGRRHVEENYDLDKQAFKLFSVIKSAAENNHGRNII